MYKRSYLEKTFDAFLIVFFALIVLIMVFPLYNVLITSFVSRGEFYSRSIIFFPREIYLSSYKFVFENDYFVKSILVTVFITVVGCAYSMALTLSLAYGLSKKYLPFRNIFLTLVLITMFFSGGLIPYYLLIRSLGLVNKISAMILPLGINVWNFIIIKSFLSQIPESLEESAKLDGANDIQILYKIIIPLSMPVIATFTLFYGVDYWNSWWLGLLFINDPNKHPLQLILRRMIVQNEMPTEMIQNYEALALGRMEIFQDGIRMATVVIAVIPILCVYPYLQKYFAKGVMLGSIKG